MAEEASVTKSGHSRARGRPCWCDLFLEAYGKTGDLTEARKAAGIGRTALYAYAADDPEFDAQWKEIREVWIDIGRDRCAARWIYGAPETVFLVTKRDPETGEVTHEEKTVRKHSAAREKFWLERMRPKEFGPIDPGNASAVEFAQRIHEALGAIEGCMDEDEPEEGGEDDDAA